LPGLGGEVAPAAQSPLKRAYGEKVPRGPAGAGIVNEPGTRLPATPFTVSVEYAKVITVNATESAFTSSA
jgi:hypothetical protein